MEKYIILKDCFLGKKNAQVKLNQRQASSLLAGRFIKKGGKNEH